MQQQLCAAKPRVQCCNMQQQQQLCLTWSCEGHEPVPWQQHELVWRVECQLSALSSQHPQQHTPLQELCCTAVCARQPVINITPGQVHITTSTHQLPEHCCQTWGYGSLTHKPAAEGRGAYHEHSTRLFITTVGRPSESHKLLLLQDMRAAWLMNVAGVS